MKKLAVIIILVLAAGGYTLYQKSTKQTTPVAQTTNTPTTTQTVIPTTSPSAASSTPTQTVGGKTYKDGTYTGDVADAFYGMMQVQLVVTGGKINDIKFLQFPDKPGHTAEVSNEALPLLRQEAIQKQSAPVDAISGATQTTDAFNQSLASALGKAQ